MREGKVSNVIGNNPRSEYYALLVMQDALWPYRDYPETEDELNGLQAQINVLRQDRARTTKEAA